MPDSIKGEAWRNIRLCVDTYYNKVPAGRFYHPGLEGGGTEFHGLADFLLTMERVLDEADFPQSFTAKRGFLPLGECPHADGAAGTGQRGALGTFTVRLMFRQHASWQGSVTWIEGSGEQSFRSVLELIVLLDSALSTRT